MAVSKRPILFGKMSAPEPFKARKPFPSEPFLPPRKRAEHKKKLIMQLKKAEQKAKANLEQKVEGATHSFFTIQIDKKSEITPSAFSQKKKAKVIWANPQKNTILVRTSTPELPALEKKITKYGEAKLQKDEKPPHQAALQPIESIKYTTIKEISGNMLRKVWSSLDKTSTDWFEISCIGGKYIEKTEAAESLNQIQTALKEKFKIEETTLVTYEAAEKLIIFLNLSLDQLTTLYNSTDCITEVEYLPPQTFAWVLLEQLADNQRSAFTITKPSDDAPVVTILDSGINSSHPSLKECISFEGSVHPEDTSPVDTSGHGTMMSGTALYGPNLLTHIRASTQQNGQHWLESVRVHVENSQTSSDPKNRSKWAVLTKDAVDISEAQGKKTKNRIYTLAITSPLPIPGATTSWSTAIDDLTYNSGDGRLFFVSQGNCDPININLTKNFPQENLLKKIEDPAQAVNAITVSGYTELVTMPPDQMYKSYSVLSPAGGASIHGISGRTKEISSIKPDCVFEAGNALTDGSMVLTDVSTITLPSTSHNLDQKYAPFFGTSLSTALAANFAARLWKLHPKLKPETVRALMIHSASWTEQMKAYIQSKKLSKDDLISLFGYGVPDFELASECLNSRATIVIEDSMPNGHIISKTREVNGKSQKSKSLARDMKGFKLPIPKDELLQLNDKEVELRVTLSYFAEPNNFGGQKLRGMDLIWDIQGPHETEEEFLRRINDAKRTGKHGSTKSFSKWDIGIKRRKSGTVQSDRWRGSASDLAGDKLIAVYPKYGWWNERKEFQERMTNFSLVVSITVPDLDIYTFVQQKIATPISVEVKT